MHTAMRIVHDVIHEEPLLRIISYLHDTPGDRIPVQRYVINVFHRIHSGCWKLRNGDTVHTGSFEVRAEWNLTYCPFVSILQYGNYAPVHELALPVPRGPWELCLTSDVAYYRNIESESEYETLIDTIVGQEAVSPDGCEAPRRFRAGV